jgi:methionyl aminopeptidase
MIRIKTKEDIAILREAGKRHSFIFKELIGMVKPGVHTIDLNNRVEQLIREGGDIPVLLNFKPYGAKRPYPATLCVSVNDEIVHGIPTENDRELREGDIVSLDFALRHKGMVTDAAVTVPVGKVSPESERLLAVTKEALMAGIKAAKGGRRIGDISSAIERIGVANKCGIVEDLAGHGVGYEVHEEPYVPNVGDPGVGETLKPGMVIAIEPMFNAGSKKIKLDKDGYTYRTVDGSMSAHFEHTVLITKSSAEILTQ